MVEDKNEMQDQQDQEDKKVDRPVIRAKAKGIVNPELLEAFLPSELIGGTIPYVPGTEEEAVWNAAVHALGTERVAFTYTVYDNRCWYLAIPSSVLASNPHSWCPLAAALPGNSEYWDRETVYLYEQDGIAAALRWDPETGRMQVFTGASRTVLPRIQTMDASFVSIDEEKAEVVPWIDRALNEERLARLASKTILFSGVLVVFASLGYWVFATAMAALITPDMEETRARVQVESNKLIVEAVSALKSESREHLGNIQNLLDALVGLGGTLVRYEVFEDGKAEWEVLVPKAVDVSRIGQFRGKPEGLAEDGRMRVKGNI